MSIIKNGVVATDTWEHLTDDDNIQEGNIIVSLDRWENEKDMLSKRSGALGIRLEPDQHPESIKDDLHEFALIAICFPTFMDGRGYSYAKILRDRYGYEGDLRAVGDVLRDQIFYMQRCGFDSYESHSHQDIHDIVKGLQDFSETYQVSADEKQPLYRRR